MKVLIIIPAYNEEANIPFVADDLKNFGDDALLVDDGSSDATASTAQAQGLEVIRLPFNLGIGGAVQTGLKYAVMNGYDAAVQFDGDGQHRADQIKLILQPVISGEADLVIGSRVLGSDYRFSPARRIGGRIFSFLIRLLSGQTITDPTSGFRCYGKKAMELFSIYYSDDYPEVESIMEAKRNGLKIVELPVMMRQRQAGHSSISGRKSLYYMIKVSLAITISALRGKERKRKR